MRIPSSLFAMVVSVAATASAQQGGPAPEVVVQQFVDAALARDAWAMARLVAPDAVFARFPSGVVVVAGRDSIQTFYERSLRANPPNFHIVVRPRIVEGEMVIDQEHFTGHRAGRTQATWIYHVRDGLIQRAWVVDATPATGARR